MHSTNIFPQVLFAKMKLNMGTNYKNLNPAGVKKSMITEHNIKSNNNYLNSVSNEAAVSCVHQKSDNKRYLTQVIMI